MYTILPLIQTRINPFPARNAACCSAPIENASGSCFYCTRAAQCGSTLGANTWRCPPLSTYTKLTSIGGQSLFLRANTLSFPVPPLEPTVDFSLSLLPLLPACCSSLSRVDCQSVTASSFFASFPWVGVSSQSSFIVVGVRLLLQV